MTDYLRLHYELTAQRRALADKFLSDRLLSLKQFEAAMESAARNCVASLDADVRNISAEFEVRRIMRKIGS